MIGSRSNRNNSPVLRGKWEMVRKAGQDNREFSGWHADKKNKKDYARLMSGFQGFGNLEGDFQGFLNRNGAGFDPISIVIGSIALL
jgi:hypothetical protein